MVHTEVVLQRDRRKSLGSTLHLHVLLGFNRLMESIRPAAAFHHTTGLLIDDLHFAAVDDVIDVFFEECICLEELVYGVYALGLDGIVGENIIFLLLFFLGRESSLVLQFRHL